MATTEYRDVESAASARMAITMRHMLGRLKEEGFLVEGDEDREEAAKCCAREIAEKALSDAGDFVGDCVLERIYDIAPGRLERDPNW